MANQEHAALVLQGEAWRRWRNENVDVTPDLRANLRGTNLVNANLGGADLSHAHLNNADLTWANLTGAV